MPAVQRRAASEPALSHGVLVGLLAFSSGGVDAVTLIALGGAFTSVITGNLVFIGRAVGGSTLSPATHALLAVAGYVTGVAMGSQVGRSLHRSTDKAPWPRRASVVLAVECVLLAGLNVAWIGYRASPPVHATDTMLVIAAVALGLQGSAARLISPAPSTTYMTGALTLLVEALTTQRRPQVDVSAIAGLLALVAGAAAAAILVDHVARLALLPPLSAVTCVLVVKSCHHRREKVLTRSGTNP